MGKIQSFRDLEIWKKGMDLVETIYRLSDRFPDHERYGLSSQMRRCAVSVPSNAAEGFRRRHSAEFRQFLNIILGSLAELETQVLISTRLGYLQRVEEADLLESVDHLNRMVANLLKKVGC